MIQKDSIHEIICVDDGSVDETNEVASSFGITVITLKDKPHDWKGKSWACQVGAHSATGDILLFLDADVRVSPNAISNLVHANTEYKCVISVQPYHDTIKYYEQCSFFFNIIQIGGIGITFGKARKNEGLCGPVILIDKGTYSSIGGHTSAKNSIVDDLALANKLEEMNFSSKLFLGGDAISFRMYGNNFTSLLQGWTKNFATGAIKIPIFHCMLVFLWITSCLATSTMLVRSVLDFTKVDFLVSLGLYVVWVFELHRISKNIGSFKKSTKILFPLYLVFFLYVFIVSAVKKIFQLDVVWKGRKIKLD